MTLIWFLYIFEGVCLFMSRRLPWLFPKGFIREADENPVPPGHPFFEDLIEKDEPIVAKIEARQLEVLKSRGVEWSIDLSTR